MTGRLAGTLQLNDNRWIREVIGFLRKKEKTMDKWRDFGEFSTGWVQYRFKYRQSTVTGSMILSD